ncbi:MAG: GIY-YIG nuclease family protein [Usitatibacter sp.]
MKDAQEPASGWFLYVIECEDGSLYTGIAVDPHARFAAHAAGKGARYTRSHRPVRLLLTLAFADRSSALKAEHRVKRMRAGDKRRFVQSGEFPAAFEP